MKLTGYKVKDKKALGLFAAAAVIVMFAVRFVLFSNGTIDEMYTLDNEDLLNALTSCEVTVKAADAEDDAAEYSGKGTILDARKSSASDDDYTLTIATALSVTGTKNEERLLTVTLPDGSEEPASLIVFNENDGYALIQCMYPEELEVYYSLDILYRLAENDPIYVLSDDVIVGGTVTDPGASSENAEDLVIVSTLETPVSEEIEGAGLYGKSGNYLGLIISTGDTQAALQSIPADVIMAALNAAL